MRYACKRRHAKNAEKPQQKYGSVLYFTHILHFYTNI